MPLFAPESTYPTKEQKQRALNRAQSEAFDWMTDHGDTFPKLRDLYQQIHDQVDKERQQL